jgi:hypothetical protein
MCALCSGAPHNCTLCGFARMIDRIDVTASIRKRRVVYRETVLTRSLDFVIYCMLVLFPTFFASQFFLLDLRNSELGVTSWLLLLGGVWLSTAILRNTLKISGLTEYVVLGDCRTRVQNLVAKKGWIKRDTKAIFVALLPMSALSWGEQLTVIYLDGRVLLNTVSFGMPRIRSPFHVAKCQEISDRFAEELNAEAAT